ncbi:MAG: TolC family protein [Acidobacteria bacterium]|nr:MAG: TolC family protein [Acidobacteriota bacterium]
MVKHAQSVTGGKKALLIPASLLLLLASSIPLRATPQADRRPHPETAPSLASGESGSPELPGPTDGGRPGSTPSNRMETTQLVRQVAIRAASQAEPVVSLDELIREALANNPQIQAARRMVDAKRFQIQPARTLPDPVIGFQTMGNLIPPTLQSGDPSSARTISITQPIPFPGKLALKGKMAAMAADAERWQYEQVRREVIAQVKTTYYQLYYVTKAIDIVKKDKDLLEKFERIAEAKYQVGEGIQQDVLKAQVEISRLLDRLTVLEERRDALVAQLNSLLYRPPEAPLGRPAEIRQAEFRYSMDQLYRMALTRFPLLKRQQREIDRHEYAVQLAKKNFYPDFEVGFRYFNRTPMPEMYELMFKAKVPLYFWRKQRPALHSAASELASARKRYDQLTALLYFQLKDRYLAATTAARLVELYGTAIVPQATLALESSVAAYQVGKVDFLTLLNNLITLLDYELKYYESLAEYQKALAELEPFVGIELTR